jgi:4,5:9,10-diseco-3-hydroxy-5,9,17-trioxoandrosta-1(10),2-diene-4-oate hydrolase
MTKGAASDTTLDLSAGRRVRAGDIELFCVQTGSGPSVVWLHGSGPGAGGISNFGANLEAFEDFCNFVFDLPRFGRSDKPEIAEPLLFHSADRIYAALQTLGVERAHFVGNSFGGGVAMRLAVEHPDMVDRLVLMAPGGAMPDKLGEWPVGLKTLLDYMALPEPSRDRLRAFIEIMLADQAFFTEELLEARFQASLQAHPEVRTPPNYGDLKPDLHRIQSPTLIVWGREDRTVPPDWAPVLLHGIPDAELRVLPHCGHWVMYEKRDRFNMIVGDFLRGEPR